MTLVVLFLFTVLAGLAGALWERVGISRLLKRDHPEESGAIPYPALTRKIMELSREPEYPAGMTFPTTRAPLHVGHTNAAVGPARSIVA